MASITIRGIIAISKGELFDQLNRASLQSCRTERQVFAGRIHRCINSTGIILIRDNKMMRTLNSIDKIRPCGQYLNSLG